MRINTIYIPKSLKKEQKYKKKYLIYLSIELKKRAICIKIQAWKIIKVYF